MLHNFIEHTHISISIFPTAIYGGPNDVGMFTPKSAFSVSVNSALGKVLYWAPLVPVLTTATKQQHLNCIHEVCGVAQSYLPYMQWKQN